MNRSGTSPFRGSGGRSQFGNVNEPIEGLVRRLESENISLNEEVNMLRSRTQRVAELEDKIDLVLKHNTQLLSENERLAKIINQKKSETELYKNKFEVLTTNKHSAADLDIKKYLNEIEKLKEEICDVEHAKNLQINDLKNQHHMEVQNLKKHNLGSNEKLELEIRKLKEYCDRKEYEASELNMKLVRHTK